MKSFPKSRYLIYTLSDPETGFVRYVGRSSSGIARPRSHSRLNDILDSKTHVHYWTKSLLAKGLKPVIECVEECPEDCANVNEWLNEAEMFWISYLKYVGCKLTNYTEGGGGMKGWKPSKEQCKKISERNKLQIPWNKGKKSSPEARANMSTSHIGIKRSPESIAKMRLKLIGQKRKPYKKSKPYKRIASEASHIRISEGQKKTYHEGRKPAPRSAFGKERDPFLTTKSIRCTNDGKVFPSLKSAADYYGLCSSNICKVLKNVRVDTMGKHFEYLQWCDDIHRDIDQVVEKKD